VTLFVAFSRLLNRDSIEGSIVIFKIVIFYQRCDNSSCWTGCIMGDRGISSCLDQGNRGHKHSQEYRPDTVEALI
jgi:hypothetical protein